MLHFNKTSLSSNVSNVCSVGRTSKPLIKRVDPKGNANESSDLEHLVQGHTAKDFGSRPRPDNHKAKATNFGLQAKAKD